MAHKSACSETGESRSHNLTVVGSNPTPETRNNNTEQSVNSYPRVASALSFCVVLRRTFPRPERLFLSEAEAR